MRGVGHYSIDIVNVADPLLTVECTLLTVVKCTGFRFKVVLEVYIGHDVIVVDVYIEFT